MRGWWWRLKEKLETSCSSRVLSSSGLEWAKCNSTAAVPSPPARPASRPCPCPLRRGRAGGPTLSPNSHSVSYTHLTLPTILLV
eukprot:1769621-Pleurochrysis_carterae.AAC.1